MTSGHDMPQGDMPHNDAHDKVLDHNRLQLSALLDGALAPDQARFLLRRLQHDEELAGCWSRWQLCGDILRGQAGAVLPADFAPRVAAAVAADAAATPARTPRWTRWGSGAALAASVAIVALFVGRQAPQTISPAAEPAPSRIAASATPRAAAGDRPAAPAAAPTPALPTPAAPDASGQLAAVAAVAELPRRAQARRTRAQSQRAAIRTPARRDVARAFEVAAAAPARVLGGAEAMPATSSPFAPQAVAITARPWPRALLPDAGSGVFNVDYGRHAPAAPAFRPFQPRSLPRAMPPASTAVDPRADAGQAGAGETNSSDSVPVTQQP